MNCHEARQHWELYFDSEGDPDLHLEINAHLEECPDCAKWFFQQNRFEQLLTDKVRATGGPDDEMWKKILQESGVTPSTSRRWAGLPFLLIAASVLLVVTATLLLSSSRQGAQSPDLAQMTADYHQQLVVGQANVEFASSSDVDVERYLRARVTFPVRCPPRKDAGFAVRGTRIRQIAGADAACIFGSVDGVPVSIFVFAREDLTNFPRQARLLEHESPHQCREGDFEMIVANIDRNTVLVIGATQTDKLRRVLSAYGSYGHDHAGKDRPA